MSRKRSASVISVDSDTKRPKHATPEDEPSSGQQLETTQNGAERDSSSEWADEESFSAVPSLSPTLHHIARRGIQRSIAMVLAHDGFQSASPEALESFTGAVETYLSSIIEEVKRFAISSRREAPIPSDFELMLRHHNLTISSLKPHIKGRLSNQDVTNRSENLITIDDTFNSLPLLGEELSGQPDKESKAFIPASFPGFPSTHTYRFTPQEDRRTRDSKQIREDAAKSAQLGEDALRRLVRASKMRKQKEVKSLVERDSQGKERFRLWESTMKRFMGGDRFREHADKVEIADHSMLVNADAKFSRREVSRLGKKSNAL
ncbi:uncharacterized protein TrAtP1_003836 [Trichoderma atroviride]|uniref:Transcription initiation factor TFIID subunit 8 n=1 Tax=Hypocrea atroviridis (strain ATCC 20476 / IMI 206040) TaxID=452589 RepID=G9P5L3_HYPAI|nr:uncharacterized protein TRIATDRAFT_248295 [Trichoderma atroviride IMI 206040]EHK40526.1 hypothetical protein TRIATDRAFT_248295 [Trichoderma atroviride IMI 206040]UKZ62594.1 hypothetical protein TrAtP1_003836 [Trichoderma atroviride]